MRGVNMQVKHECLTIMMLIFKIIYRLSIINLYFSKIYFPQN
jgi:hypothetical protein